MRFKIPFDLPVAKQRVHYAEFTNQHYFSILKCIATGIDEVVCDMFDAVIEDLTSHRACHMFALDKFCLLLDIRSIALGDKIEFITNTQAKASLKLGNIINMLTNSIESIEFSHTINIDDINIITHVPRKLKFNDIDDVISSCIHSIRDHNDTYMFDEMSKIEQQMLMGSLPAEVTNRILDHIKINKSSLNNISIIKENTQLGINAYALDVYDNSLFGFLKSIYTDELMSFYELQFNLLSKLHISNEHFMTMTPSGSKIFINLYNKEAKKQQQEESKHNNPVGGFPAR